MSRPYTDSEEETGGLHIDSDEESEKTSKQNDGGLSSSPSTPSKKKLRCDTSSISPEKQQEWPTNSQCDEDTSCVPSSSRAQQPEPIITNYLTADPSTFVKQKPKHHLSPALAEKLNTDIPSPDNSCRSPKSPKNLNLNSGFKTKSLETVDVATCVTEDDPDESSLRAGTYINLKILIEHRTPSVDGGHVYNFTTTVRGKSLYGVFGDGFSPIIHNSQIQKRAAAAEKEKDDELGGNEISEKRDESPKPRNPKRSRDFDGHHRSPSKHHKSHRHKSPKPAKLVEVDDNDHPFFRCPHAQCGHRYIRSTEMNSHLLCHVTTELKNYDDSASQTDPMIPNECKDCKMRAQKEREENSLKALFGHAKISGQSSIKLPESSNNIKKELLEDEPAPKLEKEIPTSEMVQSESPETAAMREARLPTMPSYNRPTASAALSGQTGANVQGSTSTFVNPQVFGGPFNANFANPALLPGGTQNKNPFQCFGSASSHVSPNPQIARAEPSSASASTTPNLNRHKIHELKTESNAVGSSVQLPTTAMPPTVATRSITAGTSGGPSIEHQLIGIRPPIIPTLSRPQIASPMQLPLGLPPQQLNSLMNAQALQFNQAQAYMRMQQGLLPGLDINSLIAQQQSQLAAMHSQQFVEQNRQQQQQQQHKHNLSSDPSKR